MHNAPSKTPLLGLTAVALLSATTAQAAPPAAPPAPAAPATSAALPTTSAAPPTGPLVAGVCLLSQEGVIGGSKVGLAATARIRELAAQVQASLNGEKARLEARGRALGSKRATLTPLQIQAQSTALNESAQALQAKAGERSSQLEATKSRVFAKVLQQSQPFVADAYKAHSCGLLLAREAVLFGNMANDLTPEVIAAFDAKGTPISFDLEPPRPAK